MGWTAAPALTAILHDADRVAPARSHASDGTIGDAAHSASQSDHNPDGRGVVHACDVTNDPAHGFDSWRWAQIVANRMAWGQEHRVHYLVSNDGQKDVIFNPQVSMSWRQNGSVKQEHRQHLHVSILYTSAAENDTTPFFVDGQQEEDMTKDEHDTLMWTAEALKTLLTFMGDDKNKATNLPIDVTLNKKLDRLIAKLGA